jgi:hypothetical protein
MTSSSSQAAAPARSRRRAKPRPPRPRPVLMAELRGLGGLVLEQALMDASAQPVTSILEWADQLAGELGVEKELHAATYADLMQSIVRVNRAALAA